MFMMTNGVVRVTNWVVGIKISIIEKSVIIGNKYLFPISGTLP